jgi:long-chain acyl-CoA synthetase
VISVNRPKHFKFGTVGRILPNVEVKIAEDGEILTKGPCVMKGYYKNEAATQEAIRDGWFHTGDIGCFDEEGFLKITDRKKDIIVTSGGKNISPQNIENLILGDKLFLQVIVVGDQRNYLVALIVPNQAEVLRYADAVHLSHLPLRELLKHPQIYEWVESRLKERTKDLAPYEQIKYFALFDHELTLAAGELTPTLKVKRKVVMEKYRDLIENLYRKGAERVPSPSIKT